MRFAGSSDYRLHRPEKPKFNDTQPSLSQFQCKQYPSIPLNNGNSHPEHDTTEDTHAKAEQRHGQVHSSASDFASGVSKAEAYQQVLVQARALFEGQRNWVW